MIAPNLPFWICKCDWGHYVDFRVLIDQGNGHVRVSFYPDQIIISDLYVSEKYRKRGYATALLNYADFLVLEYGKGKKATIVPLTDWEREWYIRRGYEIIEEE